MVLFSMKMKTTASLSRSIALFLSTAMTIATSRALSQHTPKPRILITGANSGIGLALTKQLVSDHGCHVYLGSRNEERGRLAVEEVKAHAGHSVELLPIDVSSVESVRSAAACLGEKIGDEKLYAIVNNAGTGFSRGTSPKEILDTNTRGPRRVVDNFMPFLNQSGGRIVNVGSGGGPKFLEQFTSDEDKMRFLKAMSEEEIALELAKIEAAGDAGDAYRGSKALLACYSMDLAEKYPNLLISTITPGWIKTKMTAGSAASKEPHEGTVSLLKCLFGELPGSGYFWGSDGLRSPLHYLRNPGEPEYDGSLPFDFKSNDVKAN